jgi:predicted DNA-binding WGR domain protein
LLFIKGKNIVQILNHKSIYWECTVDGHSKFWAGQIFEREVAIYDAMGHLIKNTDLNRTEYVLERKWGMIGTSGQRMEQIYSNRDEAERALELLRKDKENKGYLPIF